MRTPLLAAFVLLALVPRTGDEDAVYEIRVHSKAQVDTAAAELLLEEVWERTVELWGLDAKRPEDALPVHLYESYEDYCEVDEELTGGTFRENWGFSSHDRRSSHVPLQPPLAAEGLARVGLTTQTLRLVAHEASHLGTYELVANHRSHPGWLAEGLACQVDFEVLLDQGLVEGLEEDPHYGKNVLRVQRLLAAKELPKIEELVSADPEEARAGLGWRDLYACRFLVFRFLAEEHSGRLEGLLAEARGIGGGKEYAEDLEGAFHEAFKRKKLDKEFAKWVGGFEPRWDEAHGSMETVGDEWFQAAFPETNAVCWRREDAGRGGYRLKGRVTILPGASRQVNVLLGKEANGDFLAVNLVANDGVSIQSYDAATDDFDKLDSAPAEIPLGEEFEFEVAVKRKGDVSLDVDGEEVLEIDVEDRALAGFWGLGCQAGAAGIWAGITLE